MLSPKVNRSIVDVIRMRGGYTRVGPASTTAYYIRLFRLSGFTVGDFTSIIGLSFLVSLRSLFLESWTLLIIPAQLS